VEQPILDGCLPDVGTDFSVLQELWSEDSTIDALGIAGTMASGIMAVQYGAMVCSPM
jgi:hypothetical protein